jgi:hypothetical protein
MKSIWQWSTEWDIVFINTFVNTSNRTLKDKGKNHSSFSSWEWAFELISKRFSLYIFDKMINSWLSIRSHEFTRSMYLREWHSIRKDKNDRSRVLISNVWSLRWSYRTFPGCVESAIIRDVSTINFLYSIQCWWRCFLHNAISDCNGYGYWPVKRTKRCCSHKCSQIGTDVGRFCDGKDVELDLIKRICLELRR